MKLKKLAALLTAGIMAGSVLAACGTGNQTNSGGNTSKEQDNTQEETEAGTEEGDPENDNQENAESSGNSDVKATLNTCSMFGGTDPNAEVYQTVIEAFKVKYPNVTIEDNSQASDQAWKAKIAAQFSVGDEPDVIQFFTDNNASSVLSTDKFVTIEEIREVYPDYAAHIMDSAWRASANPDGVNRAVPVAGYWEGLFCNKDLFDEYDLAIPTTWEEFETAVAVFKENDVVPIAVSLNEVPHYWIEHLLLAESGGEDFTAIPQSADEIPAGWVSGLNMIKYLYEQGAFPVDCQTISNDAAGELFKTKQAAMQLDGSWYAGGVTDQENTVVVPFPCTPDGKKGLNDIVGGLSSGYYITRKAWDDPEKRDLAVEFVNMHTSKEQIEIYWGGNGLPTVELEAPEGMSPLGIAGLELSNAATGTFAPTDSRLAGEAYSAIVTSIVDLVNGTVAAEEILENAVTIHLEATEE